MPEYDKKFEPLIRSGEMTPDEACHLTGYEMATGDTLEHVPRTPFSLGSNVFIAKPSGYMVESQGKAKDGSLNVYVVTLQTSKRRDSTAVYRLADGVYATSELSLNWRLVDTPNATAVRNWSLITDGQVYLADEERHPAIVTADSDPAGILQKGANVRIGTEPPSELAKTLHQYVRACPKPMS